MRNIILIFKTNFYRLLAKKSIILTLLIFIPFMIGGGIYFTSKMNAKANIAVVSLNKKLNMENKNIKITVVDKKPPLYQLVMNKYDAIITDNGKGKFTVTTIKSDKIKNQIEKYLKEPNTKIEVQSKDEKRGTGTNIIGFLLMLVLMYQMYLMTFYPEDRDFGTFRRMLVSPLSSGRYLLSQGIFDFVIIFIPIYLSIVAVKLIFNINIGFSYLTLAGLVSLMMLMGTAFAVFMTSAMDDLDNASMLGNFIIMFASIISGSFYNFTNTNKVLDTIVKVIPIKSYMTLVQGVENGKALLNYSGQLIHIFAYVLVFFALGTIITKKNLSTGKY